MARTAYGRGYGVVFRRSTGGGASPPSTPATIFGANLFEWHRGDSCVVTGAGVSDWIDKSGNSRSVVQATDSLRPPLVDPDALFGGRATINPDGTDDFLKSALAASTYKFLHDGTGCAVFVVVRSLTGSFGSRVILDTTNGSAANSGVLLFRGGTTDSNGTVNITVGAGGSAAVTHTTAAGTFNNNLNHIIGFTYQESRSPTEWELRLNRAATASGNSAIAPSVANPFGALTIGRLTSSNSLFWRGKQADIILVNRGVTTAEMIQVEDYILDYYGF